MSACIELTCVVIEAGPSGFSPGDWNYQYVVLDPDGEVVASGISSSGSWVRNDAGGYHTKSNFDERYGADQWTVSFDEMWRHFGGVNPRG